MKKFLIILTAFLLASCSMPNGTVNIVKPDKPSLFLGKLI